MHSAPSPGALPVSGAVGGGAGTSGLLWLLLRLGEAQVHQEEQHLKAAAVLHMVMGLPAFQTCCQIWAISCAAKLGLAASAPGGGAASFLSGAPVPTSHSSTSNAQRSDMVHNTGGGEARKDFEH